MPLIDKIADEMKSAMKRGEKLRLETLRSLKAQLLEREIANRGRRDITPDDEISVLQSVAKKRKDAIELYEKGGRNDLAEQERGELAIINEFLPPQLDEAEIEAIISRIAKDAGISTAKDLRKLMGAAMQELRGKADGSIVQKIARKVLESRT